MQGIEKTQIVCFYTISGLKQIKCQGGPAARPMKTEDLKSKTGSTATSTPGRTYSFPTT